MTSEPRAPYSARLAVFTLLVMTGLFALLAGAVHAADRVALVIGMSKYETIAPLDNTVNDANAIGETLKTLGFEVNMAIDQPLATLVDTINDFSFKSETASVALVYYAGHGVELNGQNFLIPVDVRVTRPEQINQQAITLKALLGAVEKARQLRVVILDSCRNNPFENWPIEDTDEVGKVTDQGEPARLRRGGLAVPSAAQGMLVVYAAKEGEVALDGEGGHSPFARALMAELPSRNVEIGLMFRQVRDKVMLSTRNKQQPHFYGSLSGAPFFLAGSDINVAALGDRRLAWSQLAADQAVQLASLASEGNTRAMLGLGYMSLAPDKKNFNPDKAFNFFNMATEKGDPEAMYELAKLYEKGVGVQQDVPKAIALYRQSAELGFADAINDLGFLYYQGADGLPRDPKKAVDLFLQAADKRHPQAMFNAAALIDDGIVPGKSQDDAAYYLYSALRSGVSDVLAQLTDNPNQFKPGTRKALQNLLAKNQFYSGPIDGSIGKGTQRSMKIAFGETPE